MKSLTTAALALLTATAHATTYTGTVVQVGTQVSDINWGNTRISIMIPATSQTACTVAGASLVSGYAIDLPSGGLVSVWEAMLLAAVSAGTRVVITGNGTCDADNVEGVLSITALP